MNGIALSELCCLLCCPPCPSRIASKLAFLPPEATYSYQADESGTKFSMHFTEKAEWQHSERERENIEGFYARTSRGNKIGCIFVRCSPNARFVICFSVFCSTRNNFHPFLVYLNPQQSPPWPVKVSISKYSFCRTLLLIHLRWISWWSHYEVGTSKSDISPF